MDATERDELARLTIRWVRAAADSCAAFYAPDPLTGEFVETVALEQRAARETMSFLYGLAVEQALGTPNRALKSVTIAPDPPPQSL